MEPKAITVKEELIAWIREIEDISVLQHLEAIKNRSEKPFDFDEEWEKGYTVEEARAESIRRIKSWWKDRK
ncbi:MAG: hypothetical protein ACX93O_00455 [Flagellimonas sp.]|nr:hypothetical protein [Allomuricauda sp.]MBA4744943.1 hypothetical protein [Allomuricauda sp.]